MPCRGPGWLRKEILLSLSDGRGTSWSTPLRADTSSAGKFATANGVLIHGTKVFVLWEDERNDAPGTAAYTESDLVLNVYDTTTGTFSGEVTIPKTTPPGTGSVASWRAVVTEDIFTLTPILYVLQSVDLPTTTTQDLALFASTDGGLTFPTQTTLVSGASGIDVDAIALAGDDVQVWLAWQDDRNDPVNGFDDVWFDVSIDGGATFILEQQLDASGPGVGDADSDLAITAEAMIVAVAWQEEGSPPGGPEDLHVNISTGGGFGFNGDSTVGGYTSGLDDVDAPALTITTFAEIVVAWDDDRTGSDEVYVARSISGIAFLPDVQVSSAGGNFARLSRTEERGVAVAYSAGAFPNTAAAAWSTDGGATFNPEITLSSPAAGDVDFVEMVDNELYNNLVIPWLDDRGGTNDSFAGGFRPQTITVNGFVSGPTTLSADFEEFETMAAVGWLLFDLAPGNALIPVDGRNVGLLGSQVLSASIQLDLLGVTSANLGSGAGSSIPIPFSLPPGLTLYAVGMSIVGLSVLGSLTDVLVLNT